MSGPLRASGSRFLIDGRTLVIAADEFTVGRWDGGADLTLFGQLHSRHALIRRSAGRHWLSGLDGSVWVNGGWFPPGASTDLADGDLVGFDDRAGGRWQFTLPVEGSLTANLSPLGLVGESARPGLGRGIHQVSMLADELIVRPKAPAHVVRDDLPCAEIQIRPRQGGLSIRAAGAELWLDQGEAGFDDWGMTLSVPSVVWIETRSEADEIDRLLAVMRGEHIYGRIEIQSV